MANTIKNAGQLIGATDTTIYTAPAATRVTVHAAWFANLHASNQQTVTVKWHNSSGGSPVIASHTLLNDVPIPVNDTLIFDKPVNLEPGDSIVASCSSANDVEATLALVEFT